MNRLANESSAYLRQHADNPVDWYAWSNEAFEAARTENKPVLLSVGYAACHWCHVMAHESFEDEATAKLMNEWFINIKVDREERPDVDAIYMDAVQAVAGQGGWPMTVFLTPDAKPFFAGTYFPKESFAGHRSFTDIMTAVADAWQNREEDILNQAEQLTQGISQRVIAEPTAGDVYANGNWWTDSFRRQLHASHDAEWGGFGGAPKFPPSMAIDTLLRSDDELDLQIAVTTLDAMAAGGIYDHIGGGFHRYSVDAFWMVPHFEKMLYDQALLAAAYLHTYGRTEHERYKQVAEDTITFVLNDLANPGGGFFSAIDADSEGEEGLFYIWRPNEIAEALQDDALAQAVTDWYGVTNGGNFEGANILHRPDRTKLERPDNIEQARRKLLDARSKRVAPLTDDKVLTEWNAMFIATLAEAATALENDEWLTRAEESAEFLFANLRVDGRWMRTWHASTGARIPAFAADYAWVTEMCTRLAEATGKAQWQERAKTTAFELINLFWDENNLFTTGKDAEALIIKQKDLFDGAIPSANSAAAFAFARLGLLIADKNLLEHAEKIIKSISEPLVGHPTAFPHYFAAIDVLTNNTTTTVIAGEHPELVNAIHASYLPRNLTLWGEKDDNELWTGKDDGAYVCRNQTCDAPTASVEELLEKLEK